MPLSAGQLSVFKSAILGDGALSAARTAGDQGVIAGYYNASAGAGSIWRPSISASEMNTAIVWSEFITLSAVVQNGYFALIQGGVIDATNANVRAGFASIFSGKVSLTNLVALAARVPTRFEALFTTSNVCSCFGQTVTVADVAQALGS